MNISSIKITQSIPKHSTALITILVFVAIVSYTTCKCCLRQEQNGRGCLQCTSGMNLVRKNCIRKIQNCGRHLQLQCELCIKNYQSNANKTKCFIPPNSRMNIFGFGILSQQLAETPKFKLILDSIKRNQEKKIPSLTLIRKYVASRNQQDRFPTADIPNPIILRLIFFFQKGIIERTYQYIPPDPRKNLSSVILPQPNQNNDFFLKVGQNSLLNGGMKQNKTIQTLLISKEYLNLRGSQIIDIFQSIQRRPQDNRPLYYNNRVLYLPTLYNLIVQKNIPSVIDVEINLIKLQIKPNFASTGGATGPRNQRILDQPLNSQKTYIQTISQLQRTQPYRSYLQGSRMLSFQLVEGQPQSRNSSYIGNTYNVTFVHPDILDQQGKALISYILFKIQSNNRVKVSKNYFVKRDYKPPPLRLFQRINNIANNALRNNMTVIQQKIQRITLQNSPSSSIIKNEKILNDINMPMLRNITTQLGTQEPLTNRTTSLSNVLQPNSSIQVMQEQIDKMKVFQKEIYKKIRQIHLLNMFLQTKSVKNLVSLSSGSNSTHIFVQICYNILKEADERYRFMTFSIDIFTRISKVISQFEVIVQTQTIVNTNKYLQYNMTVINQGQQALDEIDKNINQMLKLVYNNNYYLQLAKAASQVQLAKLTVIQIRDDIIPNSDQEIDFKRYIFKYYLDFQGKDNTKDYQFVEFRFNLIMERPYLMPIVLFRKQKFADIGNLKGMTTRQINLTRKSLVGLLRSQFPTQANFQVQAILKSQYRNQVFRVFMIYDNKRYKFQLSESSYFNPYLYSLDNLSNSTRARLLFNFQTLKNPQNNKNGQEYFNKNGYNYIFKHQNIDYAQKNRENIYQQQQQVIPKRQNTNLRKNNQKLIYFKYFKHLEHLQTKQQIFSEGSQQRVMKEDLVIQNCMIQHQQICIACKIGYILKQSKLFEQKQGEQTSTSGYKTQYCICA